MCYLFSYGVRTLAAAIVLAMIGVVAVRGEWKGDKGDGDHRRPVYQRRAFEWKDKDADKFRRHHGRVPPFISPPVSAGWFQRPYPYHLDYYRMRYGGSYAPYFGNLYGPPQVVTAPPYYGPYYGGYGGEFPMVNGGAAYPGLPGGMMYGSPMESEPVTDGPNASPLPAP